MRSIVVGLALVFAAIPVAHAQELAIPAPATPVPTSQPELRQMEAPANAVEVDLAPVAVEAVEATYEVADAQAQVSARNVLAIIGAIVVVVALVALFK